VLAFFVILEKEGGRQMLNRFDSRKKGSFLCPQVILQRNHQLPRPALDRQFHSCSLY